MPTPPVDPSSGLPLLADAEFERLNDLQADEFEQLDPELLAAFLRTADYHAGERQRLHVNDVFIDGKPAAHVLEELEAEESGQT